MAVEPPRPIDSRESKFENGKVSLRRRIKRLLPEWVLEPALRLQAFAYRRSVALRCGLAWLWDKIAPPKQPVPPPILRFRVSGTPSSMRFLQVGQRSAQSIAECLEKVGRPLDSLPETLDFGCGCGRTLYWLHRMRPHHRFHGTDVDEEAIAWCRKHLKFGRFSANQPLPPLTYPDRSFDLAVALSVFTHLPEKFHEPWLLELRRVLKPNGVLLATFHGEAVWSRLDADQAAVVRERGILVTHTGKTRGICPDWYQTAFHSRQCVLDMFGRSFQKVDYLPEAMGYQDVAVCQAPQAFRR